MELSQKWEVAIRSILFCSFLFITYLPLPHIVIVSLECHCRLSSMWFLLFCGSAILCTLTTTNRGLHSRPMLRAGFNADREASAEWLREQPIRRSCHLTVRCCNSSTRGLPSVSFTRFPSDGLGWPPLRVTRQHNQSPRWDWTQDHEVAKHRR